MQKIIFRSELSNKTPLIIGSGESGIDVDSEVLKDSNDKPFIPATSFVGKLRAELVNEGVSNNLIEKFFGNSKGDKSSQGIAKFSDIYCISDTTNIFSVRDGIKIDSEKGITQETGKYNYEVTDTGSRFILTIVADITDNSEEMKNFLFTLKSILSENNLSLGAKTSAGFGKMTFSNSKFYHLDLSNSKHLIAWLKYDFSDSWFEQFKHLSKSTIDGAVLLKTKYKRKFEINADFHIKSSLIIKDYNSNSQSDAVSIKNDNKFVIPGSSLKGVIRSRSERIINTLNLNSSNILENLFGQKSDPKTNSGSKGKIVIQEAEVNNVIAELQNRIKIDRFTSGTIEGALFNSSPLWSDKNSTNLKLEIKITDPKEYEIGLILLVLKDLWLGDLAIGGEKNIGRGVLQGLKAEIKDNDKIFKLNSEFNADNEISKQALQDYVTDLINLGDRV